MKLIVPTILVKTRNEFIRRRAELKPFFKLAQLDIMDGKFVPNRTLQLDNIKRSKLQYEVHFMVKDNITHIKKALKLHPAAIIFHYESCRNSKEIAGLINFIRRRKIKAGIALNPETPIVKVIPYLKQLDRVMFMAVHPGFSGQKFKSIVLKKIKALRKLNKRIDIEVDGGINDKNIKMVQKAGANIFSLGSYLTDPDMQGKLQLLRKRIA